MLLLVGFLLVLYFVSVRLPAKKVKPDNRAISYAGQEPATNGRRLSAQEQHTRNGRRNGPDPSPTPYPRPLENTPGHSCARHRRRSLCQCAFTLRWMAAACPMSFCHMAASSRASW